MAIRVSHIRLWKTVQSVTSNLSRSPLVVTEYNYKQIYFCGCLRWISSTASGRTTVAPVVLFRLNTPRVFSFPNCDQPVILSTFFFPSKNGLSVYCVVAGNRFCSHRRSYLWFRKSPARRQTPSAGIPTPVTGYSGGFFFWSTKSKTKVRLGWRHGNTSFRKQCTFTVKRGSNGVRAVAVFRWIRDFSVYFLVIYYRIWRTYADIRRYMCADTRVIHSKILQERGLL